MAVIRIERFESCDGWCGPASAIGDGGMVDDAQYLISAIDEERGALAMLDFEALLPEGSAELVIRSQRMSHGRSSGTGQPAALTVALYQSDRLLLSETLLPGGSWREDRLTLPEDLAAEPLALALLVPPGERQVAISRAVIEATAVVEVTAAGAKSAAVAAGDLVAEPVAACAVVPAAADAAAGVVADAPLKESGHGRRRARDEHGRYQGDDPSTDGVNEAWQTE